MPTHKTQLFNHEHGYVECWGTKCPYAECKPGYCMRENGKMSEDDPLYTTPKEQSSMMRPGFDEWCLDKAAKQAERSRDPSTKCGCIIVRPDKTTCSEGYNGFPRSMEDKPEWWNNRDEKYDRVIHAEMNALLWAREPVLGYTAYITGPSCKDCAKHIAAAGIARVVWYDDPEFRVRWNCDRSIQILEEAGVEVSVLQLKE